MTKISRRLSRRIDDVDRAAAVLLDHRRALRQPRVGLLADRGEDLQVVVDAAQLVGDLDQPELGEVPDVGRELAGHAGVGRAVLDVLVEVLVDAVDEDRQRRVQRAQPRHQVAVGVGRAALQLARREVEQAHEVVDDAVQLGVGDQAGQPRADLQPVGRADVLEHGQRDRREPDLRPRQRRRGEQRDRLAAEDLVADRLVEQVAARQADGVALALVEDALGLEQQRLAEALGADDDELVVAPRGQEAVDLGRTVQQRLVEILGNADVVGVDGPGAHGLPDCWCSPQAARIVPSIIDVQLPRRAGIAGRCPCRPGDGVGTRRNYNTPFPRRAIRMINGHTQTNKGHPPTTWRAALDGCHVRHPFSSWSRLPSGATTTSPATPCSVRLQLKWRHQFQFAGFYAALEKGYYREAGFDVTIVPATPGMDPVETVLKGDADFGVASSELVLRYARGDPVVVLATIFEHSPLALFVRRDAGIEAVRDLAGHKVALAPWETEIFAYLQRENVPLDPLQLVQHDYSVDTLVQGRVDALAGYETDETYYLQQAGGQFREFTPRSSGVDFYGDTLFTTRAMVTEHPEWAEAFRAASLRGWEYALAHQEEIAVLIHAKYAPDLPLEKLRFEGERMMPLVRSDLVELGHTHVGRWQHIFDVYREIGLVPRRRRRYSGTDLPAPAADRFALAAVGACRRRVRPGGGRGDRSTLLSLQLANAPATGGEPAPPGRTPCTDHHRSADGAV